MLASLTGVILMVAAAGTTPVIAEVNGDVVLERDVVAIVSPAFKKLEEKYEGEALREKKEEYFRRSLKGLVEQKLLVQQAEASGLAVPREEIEAEMEKLAGRVGGWAALLDMLAKMGVSYDEKIQNVREQKLARMLLSREILPRIYTSPSDAKQFYDEHKSEFLMPPTSKISQIIVWKSRYADDAEARKKLEMIEGKLGDGVPFEDVAKGNSDGPHAREGGDWGYVAFDDLLDELAEALKDMKPGDVKGPIETRVGYHILRLDDVREPEMKPFADVHEQIEGLLRKRAYDIEAAEYIKELRRRGRIKIYENTVQSLLERLSE